VTSPAFVSGVTNEFFRLSATISSISLMIATPSPHECSKFNPARPFDEMMRLKHFVKVKFYVYYNETV